MNSTQSACLSLLFALSISCSANENSLKADTTGKTDESDETGDPSSATIETNPSTDSGNHDTLSSDEPAASESDSSSDKAADDSGTVQLTADFKIGDRESLSREEFTQIICDTIERCDPVGYVEFVEAKGECMPEIVEWVLVCDTYDPIAAVQCLEGATLDHLTSFHCGKDNTDSNVGAAPDACLKFCEDNNDGTVPTFGK